MDFLYSIRVIMHNVLWSVQGVHTYIIEARIARREQLAFKGPR